ncbi:MAG: hypothetical protein K2X61_01350 [Caulobacteraceae bacterium]|nr:hypothetical protein [Caulobacteraceae bacterium]
MLGPVLIAGQTRAQDQSTQLDDIVVEGRTLSEAVRQFVDDVIAAPLDRGPARWTRRVCVGVVNLRPEAGQVIADRVGMLAADTGLPVGEPGCGPNILVMATDDGAALAQAMSVSNPRIFRPGYAGATLGSVALERFQSTDDAIRWWHVSVPIETGHNTVAVRLPGRDAPLVQQDASRLTTRIRNDLAGVFVILDINRAAGLSFQQIGDYIGMVALAQIDPEADTRGNDTILNLFEEGRAVDAATDWDRSFLASLYAAELNQRRANAQSGEISSIMIRDRRAAQRETNDSAPQR